MGAVCSARCRCPSLSRVQGRGGKEFKPLHAQCFSSYSLPVLLLRQRPLRRTIDVKQHAPEPGEVREGLGRGAGHAAADACSGRRSCVRALPRACGARGCGA
jgi:hypothetical protein